MGMIIVEAKDVTADEERKLLHLIWNLSRKRRHQNKPSICFEVNINGKQHMSRQQN